MKLYRSRDYTAAVSERLQKNGEHIYKKQSVVLFCLYLSYIPVTNENQKSSQKCNPMIVRKLNHCLKKISHIWCIMRASLYPSILETDLGCSIQDSKLWVISGVVCSIPLHDRSMANCRVGKNVIRLIISYHYTTPTKLGEGEHEMFCKFVNRAFG